MTDHPKRRFSVSPLTAFAAVAVIASVALIPSEDYRWIGHSIMGLATLGIVTATTLYGAALAGRVRRPPHPARFRLHRTYAITMGLLMLATFIYGIGLGLSLGVALLNSIHGLSGMLVVVVSGIQIGTGLMRRRSRAMKPVHSYAGYVLVFLVVLQLVFGIFSSPFFSQAGEIPRYFMRWLTVVDETFQADGRIGEREYFITRSLAGDDFQVSYRIDEDHLHIGLKVRTTGWVAIGVGGEDGMKGSDMVFGYVKDGRAVVTDHFGVSAMTHQPDNELGGKDSILESAGSEADGFTIIEFTRRPWADDDYDVGLTEGEQTIIWAYGENDDSPMHVARGQVKVQLPGR